MSQTYRLGYLTYPNIPGLGRTVRVSFECRRQIGFSSLRHMIGLENLSLLFHPIRSKNKPNRNSFAHVFPRFVSRSDWFIVLFFFVCVLCHGLETERFSVECCKTKTKPIEIQMKAALYNVFIADWCTFRKQGFLSEILLRSGISDRYINPFVKCFFQLNESNVNVPA